jgi:hypothetical protein
MAHKKSAAEVLPVLHINMEVHGALDETQSRSALHRDDDDDEEESRETNKRLRRSDHPAELETICASPTEKELVVEVAAQLTQPATSICDDSEIELTFALSTPPTSSRFFGGPLATSRPAQAVVAPKRRPAEEVPHTLLDGSQTTPKRPLFEEGDCPSLALDLPLSDVDLIEEFVCLQRGSVPEGPRKRQALPRQAQVDLSRGTAEQTPSNLSPSADDGVSSGASALAPLSGFVRSAFLEGEADSEGSDGAGSALQKSMRATRARKLLHTLRSEHHLKVVDVAMDGAVDYALGEGLGLCLLDVAAVDSMAKVRTFTKSLISASLRYDCLWLVVDLCSEAGEADRATTQEPRQRVEGPRIEARPPKLNVSPSSGLPSPALASCLAQLSRSVWHFPCPVHVRYAWGLDQTAALVRTAADAAAFAAHECDPMADLSARATLESEEALSLREVALAARLPPLNAFSAAVALRAASTASESGSTILNSLLEMPLDDLKRLVPSAIARERLDDLFSLAHLEAPVAGEIEGPVDGLAYVQTLQEQDEQYFSGPQYLLEQYRPPNQQNTSIHEDYPGVRHYAGDYNCNAWPGGASVHHGWEQGQEDLPQAHQPPPSLSYPQGPQGGEQPFFEPLQAELRYGQSSRSGDQYQEPLPWTPPKAEVRTISTPDVQYHHPASRSVIRGREEKLGFRHDPKLRGGQTVLHWSPRHRDPSA